MSLSDSMPLAESLWLSIQELRRKFWNISRELCLRIIFCIVEHIRIIMNYETGKGDCQPHCMCVPSRSHYENGILRSCDISLITDSPQRAICLRDGCWFCKLSQLFEACGPMTMRYHTPWRRHVSSAYSVGRLHCRPERVLDLSGSQERWDGKVWWASSSPSSLCLPFWWGECVVMQFYGGQRLVRHVESSDRIKEPSDVNWRVGVTEWI